MIKDFLKNKKAVLFDLDGTLVDSMWMWPQIDVEFLGRFGYDCPGDLERAVEGMSFSETAAYFKERFSLPMTLEEIKECWSQMAMDKYRTQVPLKPGAPSSSPSMILRLWTLARLTVVPSSSTGWNTATGLISPVREALHSI